MVGDTEGEEVALSIVYAYLMSPDQCTYRTVNSYWEISRAANALYWTPYHTNSAVVAEVPKLSVMDAAPAVK